MDDGVRSKVAGAIYYVDGEFIPAHQAVIPVNDLVILRGYGVFESLRTYGGKPFRMREHLIRLARSAELIGLSLPWSGDDLASIVHVTLGHNRFEESSVRLVVTGGESENFFLPTGKPRLIVMANALRPYPAENYSEGVKVGVLKSERYLPEAKATHYAPGVVSLQEAKARDPKIVELLSVDSLGRVAEGIISNVFAFFGDTLVTPGAGILYGVTRQVVLELAEPMFKTEIRDLYLDEVQAASEMFLTGSVREIMPIRMVDELVIGSGTCGENTKKLMAAFRQMVARFVGGEGI